MIKTSKLIEIIQDYTKDRTYSENKKRFDYVINEVIPDFYSNVYPVMRDVAGKKDTIQYQLKCFEEHLYDLGYRKKEENKLYNNNSRVSKNYSMPELHESFSEKKSWKEQKWEKNRKKK